MARLGRADQREAVQPERVHGLGMPVVFGRKTWGSQADAGSVAYVFSRYAGKRFTIEGVEFRMLSDDEITATVPNGAKVGGL